MLLTRRHAAAALLAAPALLRPPGVRAQATRTLKLSHQFPAGTLDKGDFRDRMARRFAADVTARTGGSLQFEIYAGGSLMKTVAQFSALRRGALDLSVYPLGLCGRRGAGGQYRPAALPGDQLRPGPGLEDGPRGKGADGAAWTSAASAS